MFVVELARPVFHPAPPKFWQCGETPAHERDAPAHLRRLITQLYRFPSMRTRSGRTCPHRPGALTLASLPDDIFQLVFAACRSLRRHHTYGRSAYRTYDDVPLFEAVKGLARVSKALQQQLYRLLPLVGVDSLAVMRRPAHGPWRVVLLYEGILTRQVMAQASQGRVHSIAAGQNYTAPPPAWTKRLLGAGSSLRGLHLPNVWLGGTGGPGVGLFNAANPTLTNAWLGGTWAATFGEGAVSSAVLRKLCLDSCGLKGPFPELRLAALEVLDLSHNRLSGGLNLLQSCTALRFLALSLNGLTGGLEPLRRCTALEELWLGGNRLTGSLAPLRGCTALKVLFLEGNQLTGGLEPLRGCKGLRELYMDDTALVPTHEDAVRFQDAFRDAFRWNGGAGF